MSFFAVLLGVFIFLVAATGAAEITLYLLYSRHRGFESLAQRILNLLVLGLYAIPSALGTALGNIFAHIQSNWKLYLVSLAALTLAFGWMSKQDVVLKGYDAYETEVVYPFNREILLPTLNVLRLFYDGVVCWFNLAAGVGRYIRWAALVVAYDCSIYNKDATIAAAAKIPLLPINATNKFFLSGFSENWDVEPTMKAMADTLTTFQPMFECQCEAIFPVVPMFLDQDYGVFQSSRLHGLPDVYLNLGVELARTHISAVLDIVEQVGGKCQNETRDCLVERGPKYGRTADLTCMVSTHTLDLVDDTINAVLKGLEEAPWNVVLPWPKNPRVFGLLAVPICYATDIIYIFADTLTHIDLFFTLPGENYAAEIEIERPISRLYNVSDLIQAIGDDLGTEITEDVACIFSRFIRLLVGVGDLAAQLIRRVFAVNFDVDDIRAFLAGPEVDAILVLLKNDVNDLGDCIERIGDKLGHGPQTALAGLAKFQAGLVDLLTGIVANSATVFDYLKSAGFETRVEALFSSTNLISAGLGGTIRQLGGFGSVECSIRNLTETPNDLTIVEMESMDLNIMCSIGTVIEMYTRFQFSLLRYLAIGIVKFTQVLANPANPGAPNLNDIVTLFGPGETLDLAQEDGVIEHACLLADSAALFVPSLFNLGANRIECPGDASKTLDEVMYVVLRGFIRVALIPLYWFNVFISATGAIGLGDDFDQMCSSLIVPYYTVTVAPIVQLALAPTEIAFCLLPDGEARNVLEEIVEFTGQLLLDTQYVSGEILPCSSISSADGGTIIDGLCGFFGLIQNFLQFISNIIQDGIWQAIWNLIVPPLEALLDELLEFFACLWGNITRIFVKIGDCGESLIDLDLSDNPANWPADFDEWLSGIEDSCGDWDEIFVQCNFELTVPTYDVDSEYPPTDGTAGSPGEVPNLNPLDISGSCCAADTCTGPFPVGALGYTPGTSDVLTVSECGAISTGLDINVFVPGLTCLEQTTCDGITTNVNETGVCCFGNAGGACNEVTYEECIQAANVSGVTDGVFIPGERCSSVDNQCNLVNSPNSRQLGCCVKERISTDPFNPFFGREYQTYSSGFDCFQDQPNPTLYRSYYIPGDRLCQEDFGDLINGSDAFTEPVQNCIPDYVYETPESRNAIFTNISSACRVDIGLTCPSLANPTAVSGDPASENYVDYGPYSTDSIEISGERTWCCRTGAITYAKEEFVPPFLNELVRLDRILDTPRLPSELPFASVGDLELDGLGERRQYALQHFDIYGYTGGSCDSCAGFASPGPCDTVYPTCTETVITAALSTVDFRVIRFVPKPVPSPNFYQNTVSDAASDFVAAPRAVMRVLFPPNVTEMVQSRDNLDLNCDVFFYPDVPLPPEARSVAARDFVDDMWVPQLPIPKNTWNPYVRNESHPCHQIYLLNLQTNQSSPEGYLIRKELRNCILSSALSHGLGYFFFSQAGENLFHPRLFMNELSVQWSTFMNVTRAIGAGWRHANSVLRHGEIERQWADYAPTVGVTDPLGIRVGQQIAILANVTIGLQRTNRSIPMILFPFQISSGAWKFVKSNRTIHEPRPVAPVLSDKGRQLLDDFWAMNWVNYSTSFNATGLAGVRDSISPLLNHPVALLEDGLTLRGLTPSYHAATGICDPRDRDCLKCRFVAETADVFAVHVVNCLEDLENTKRFNINVSALDLKRTNTFLQPGDKLPCRGAVLDDFSDHDPLGIGTWIVDTLDLRGILGRIVCHLTLYDAEDTHSPLFWLEKLVFCNATIDGSCHRGRAGIGLFDSVIYVSAGFIAVALISWLFVPVLPTLPFFSIFWVISVLSVAYFWSPSCAIPSFPIPLPVLPDCVADDIFFEIEKLTSGDCRDYGDIFDGQNCSETGRDFPQCHDDPLNFDVTGFRHFFYILDYLPGVTDFLLETEVVVFSWIREVSFTGRALKGISDVRGTPKGDYCFLANILSVLPLSFTFIGIVTIGLILFTVLLLFIVLAASLLSLLVLGISLVVGSFARVGVDTKTYFRDDRSDPSSATNGNRV